MMSDSCTIIARRDLVCIIDGAPRKFTAALLAPQSDDDNWTCAYEIDWPDAPRRNIVSGLDAIQSLLLALQSIGAELCAARPANVSDVYWLESGSGVGFPLPPSLRPMAVGEDKLI